MLSRRPNPDGYENLVELYVTLLEFNQHERATAAERDGITPASYLAKKFGRRYLRAIMEWEFLVRS